MKRTLPLAFAALAALMIALPGVPQASGTTTTRTTVTDSTGTVKTTVKHHRRHRKHKATKTSKKHRATRAKRNVSARSVNKESTRSRTMPVVARMNINDATRAQLMTLPGINAALADKIIAARPIGSGEELVSKGVLTQAEYRRIEHRISTKIETEKK